MLRNLKRLWVENGAATYKEVDKCSYTPKTDTYARIFGSFNAALSAIGYDLTARGRWRAVDGRIADNQQIVDALKEVLATHGYLSLKLLAGPPGAPSGSLLRSRFGNLTAAYEAAGFLSSHSEIAAWQRKRLASAEPPGEPVPVTGRG
ncbi:hypothetical protein [Brevundimonas diminuta]|uniref:Uncharacterized protein n=1 Tax=Brevundimonas diminuta TaxID=293 RepID=A0A1Z3LVJ1_BREDI|nr:hypothetical protein [Brevundimonas diminuta]ASD26203.1 hypothetical protein CD943_04455 [Brevundimonas diminuta]